MRRSSRSSSSRRRNSYSCSWKSSTATPLGMRGNLAIVGSDGHSAIGSPDGLAVEISRVTGSGRRSTCTRPTRTASSRPRALARHYGRAGYDVVALTDHWHPERGAVEPRPRGAPGRRAQLPPARGPRRPRARHRHRARPDRSWRASAATSPPRATGSSAPGASRTSRTRTGRAPAPGISSCRRRSRASRCSTPAASSRSAVASRRCTGTSSSRTAASARRSSPTTATIRASTPTTLDVDPGRASRGQRSRRPRAGCSTAARGR